MGFAAAYSEWLNECKAIERERLGYWGSNPWGSAILTTQNNKAMNKKQVKRGLLGAVIVAELAVLDYCAIQLMRNGISVEVSQAELVEAGEQAMIDMEGER